MTNSRMNRQLRVADGASPASTAAAGGAGASLGRVLAEVQPLGRRGAPESHQESDEKDEDRPLERSGALGDEDSTEDATDARIAEDEVEAGPSPPLQTSSDAEAVAQELARRKCCARHCLRSSAASNSSSESPSAPEPSESLRHLVASLAAMSKSEKKVCMFTSLSISSLVKPRPQRAPRPREEGVKARSRFAYWLPLVGEVCRAAFMGVFGVSHCSLNRYRKQLEDDKRLVPQMHGNARNTNAKKLDDELLARWFREFAAQVGEQVTRRVRVRKTENGQRKSAMVEQRHVQLPARFTWELLLREFEFKTARDAPRALRPSLASFRRILSEKCPEIRLGGTSAAKPKGGP